MVLAAQPELFKTETAESLPALELSLSNGIKAGVQTFLELGMREAYTGDPSASTVTFGHELYQIMSEMVVTTVTEHLRSVP